MIIDVSSCMYVRRVRAHVIHVTRDSVNGKVRRMMLEGVPDAVRKGKKGKREKGERNARGANGGQRRIIFPEFCISLRTISIYITARINMLRKCDLLCVILERGEMWENPLRKYFIL